MPLKSSLISFLWVAWPSGRRSYVSAGRQNPPRCIQETNREKSSKVCYLHTQRLCGGQKTDLNMQNVWRTQTGTKYFQLPSTPEAAERMMNEALAAFSFLVLKWHCTCKEWIKTCLYTELQRFHYLDSGLGSNLRLAKQWLPPLLPHWILQFSFIQPQSVSLTLRGKEVLYTSEPSGFAPYRHDDVDLCKGQFAVRSKLRAINQWRNWHYSLALGGDAGNDSNICTERNMCTRARVLSLSFSSASSVNTLPLRIAGMLS